MELSPQSPKETTMRARISSFNDELKDTNRLVEVAHARKNELELQIGEYVKQIEQLKSEEAEIKNKIKGLKWSLQEETIRHEDTLKCHAEEEAVLRSLNNDISNAVGELNKLNSLKPKILLLNKQIKSAERVIFGLEKTKAKIEKLANKENSKLREAEQYQEQISVEIETARRKLKEEEKIFLERVKRLEVAGQKHTQELQRFSIEQEKKDRDIRIVMARLKKKWSELYKGQPFPKI